MESTPISREQYENIEQDIHRVKSEITGDKSKEEIVALIEERERLIAGLEAERSRAEDIAREDDANLDDAREQIEKLTTEIGQYKDQIAEITGTTEEEREAITSPELAETIVRLKEAGCLDTSFESRETHSLAMRALSKDEALEEYKNSGGETWIWNELEKNMPYAVPTAGSLDVMIMNFGKNIGSDEAVAEMDKLGVRPLTYEELIQYGIVNPEHQKQKVLVGLGTKHTLGGGPRAPVLFVDGDERNLLASVWGSDWDGGCRFPVVRK